MGEGTQTPVPIAQCPTCQEQDVIEIAGKKFCANCGTPQVASSVPSDASTTASAAAANNAVSGVQSGPSLSTDAHVAEPGQSTASTPADVSTPAVPAELMPNTVSPSLTQPSPSPATADTTPSSTLSSEPTAASAAAVSPTSQDTTTPAAPTAIKLRPQAEELHNAMQAGTSPSIKKFGARPSTSDVADSITPTNVPSGTSGGSEMSSLTDESDESVMSDEALDALSQSTEEPVVPGEVTEPSAADGDQKPKQDTAPDSPEQQPTESPSSTADTPTLPSNYKLDLTQPKASTSTLPKAVSDIRPGSQATSTIPTPPPSSTAPVSAAPVVPAPTAVATPSAPTPSPVNLATPNPPVASMVAPASAMASPQPAVPSQNTAGSNTPPTDINMVASNNAAASVAADQAKPNKGMRVGSVALSLVGLFLVGAYIWQVNYPNLALKVAASKAGISANFPGYVPSGWKLSGNIQSSPGNISYNLANSQVSKSLAVTESKTDWDSQALAENYVAPKSSNYLALQAQGLTIYLYDGNQASWVNNGTWYRIEGKDHGLTQDQVIKLATSL